MTVGPPGWRQAVVTGPRGRIRSSSRSSFKMVPMSQEWRVLKVGFYSEDATPGTLQTGFWACEYYGDSPIARIAGI